MWAVGSYFTSTLTVLLLYLPFRESGGVGGGWGCPPAKMTCNMLGTDLLELKFKHGLMHQFTKKCMFV